LVIVTIFYGCGIPRYHGPLSVKLPLAIVTVFYGCEIPCYHWSLSVRSVLELLEQ